MPAKAALLLVDSSIYIDGLRAGRNPGEQFRTSIEAGRLLTCGIIRLEVLRGITNAGLREWMDALFDEMIECPLDQRLWKDAAQLAWRLDRRGAVLPVPDIAIASCALRAGAIIVSRDPHFRTIPGLEAVESVPER